LISRRARSANVQIETGIAELIAQRSKGTPRIGIRLLESCIRTMLAEAAGTVSKATFDRTCLLEQIDGLGLDAIEQRYLRLLKDARGTLRLNVLASSLGLARATVERAIEPFLIRENLIEKDESGRVLTDRGWKHLRETMGLASPEVRLENEGK
jgi:Holliday junction DNA helicase RuvB